MKSIWYLFTNDDEKTAHAFDDAEVQTVTILCGILKQLDAMCGDLAAQAADDCNVLEAQPGFEPDDFTEDEDGKPVGILYPENGSPEIEHARTVMQ